MSSYTQTDVDNLNNANGESKLSRHLGDRFGRARCEFSATGGKAIGAHTLGLTIPKGSVITKAYYRVLTTFTSATDAATIALSIVGANDVVSAVAISNGANPWDAGNFATIVTATVSTWLATTADSAVTATVAVEALTAGKLVLWVEWAYHGDVSAT
jgi:hypothetical protein